jgi:hypothetical protein
MKNELTLGFGLDLMVHKNRFPDRQAHQPSPLPISPSSSLPTLKSPKVHSKWKYDCNQELCEIQFSIFLLRCGLNAVFNQSSYPTGQRRAEAFFSLPRGPLPSGHEAQPRNLPGKAALSLLFHFAQLMLGPRG